MRTLVLGHRGMLGSCVARRLASRGFEVRTFDGRFHASAVMSFVAFLQSERPGAVVNCLGVVDASATADKHLEVNALLPAVIAAAAPQATFVHASTDGVFKPSESRRQVLDPPDADDNYGFSKLLGERVVHGRHHVIRASIVGLPGAAGRGLVGWLLSEAQRGVPTVPGYADWEWNGITARTWARVAEDALREELAPGVHHLATEKSVSKARLLELVIEALALPLSVQHQMSGVMRTRLLRPSVKVPPLETQIRELSHGAEHG